MLIILDRDGVINEDSDDYIKSPDEWIPIPGSLHAIAQLNRAGHQVVVATNQSGIARGLYSKATLKKIHAKMTKALEEVGGHLDGIFYCPHHPDENCLCRKPKPGLLLEIAKQYKTNWHDALFIGDSFKDIEAARAVNCKAMLVKTGKGLQTTQQQGLEDIKRFDDLAGAVNAILNHDI